ncbi:MAG: DHA2 family efflux MFS transporter permease subunit [Candidatus Eremiobacteraeota bacterium]|nr:DHA2 family efflux MFS transporter permease subunit [Candidatus Eremiobacteraeota bacterium]
MQTLAPPQALNGSSWQQRLRANNPNPPRALITTTVMLGVIMAIIDASIVNVALSDMAGNLGASIDEIAWVATGYILANVIVMPLNGWLTAVLGRKVFYASSLAVFTIASVLCGLSHSLPEIVVWRLLQGVGGGALQPTAQAILFESYPENKRGQAMAIFGLGAMVGPAVGPTLGGYIVDNFSWPLIFFINIPIGILAFWMTLMFVHDPPYIKRVGRGGIDWIALALMASGIGSLQYVLERGQREDWFTSPIIVVLTIVSVVGIGGFIYRELRDKNPIVDLRVFKSWSFTAANIIGVVTGFGLFGLNLVLPLFFQAVLGFGAWDTGLMLLPGAIATALSMPIAGRLTSLVSPRYPIAFGLALFAISTWFMGDLNQFAGYWNIFWLRAFQGFALGFIFVPMTTAALAGIPNSQMSNATGLYTLLRQLGGSLGIAILELLILRRQDYDQQLLAANVTLANPNVSQFLRGAHDRAAAIAQLAQQVDVNALALAYDYAFRVCAILFVLSIPTVFLLKNPPRGKNASAHIAVE